MGGVDPMTSNCIQARHVYAASEMRMNETFAPIFLQHHGPDRVTLDMSMFDDTAPTRCGLRGCTSLGAVGFLCSLFCVLCSVFWGGARAKGRAASLSPLPFWVLGSGFWGRPPGRMSTPGVVWCGVG